MWTLGFLIATAGAAPVSLRSGATFIHEGLTVRAWNTAEGLPQASVSNIVQTEDGFLWAATFAGLARFDGHSFKTFGMAPAPGGDTIRTTDVSPARDGGLWIGLELGGVLHFDGERYTRPEQPEALASMLINEVLETDDALWVAGDFGLMVRRGGEWTTLTLTGYTGADPYVHMLRICPDGEVWVAANAGLGRVEGDQLVLNGEPAHSVVCHDGTVYAGSGRGLEVWEGDGWSEAMEPEHIHVLEHDPEGHLWAAGHGFIQRFGGAAQRWELAGTLVSLTPDSEGNLWAGTERSGLLRLSEQPFEVLDDALDPHRGTGPVLTDGETLLIAQRDAPLVRARRGADGQWRAEATYDVAAAVTALGASPDGPLVGLEDGTVCRLGGRHVLQAGSQVLALRSDEVGSTWVGTTRHGVYQLSGDEVSNLTAEDGLVDNTVRNIIAAPGGDTWLTHENGVTVLRDGAVLRTFAPAQGLPPGQVRTVWFDPEGRPWIGTYGGGLGLVDGDTVRRFTSAHGLYDDAISVIVSDGAGGVWMNGNRGVSRVPYAELQGLADGSLDTVRSWPFPTGEGYGLYQPAGAALPDGRIAFAMVEGVVVMDPQTTPPAAAAPRIHVEGVSADGISVPPGGPIQAGTSEVVVSYTSPSMTWPSLIRYQTRLLEHGEAWSAPTAERQARFLGLEPGTYTLQIRALNQYGVASEVPAEVTFEQLPFWWQTRLVRGLFGVELVGLGLLIGMVGWRRARRQNHALQEQIDQRERVEEERRELSEQLNHARRLETVGRLAGGIAHDFNNLLTVVMANTELAKMDLEDLETPPEVDENLSGILDASRRGSELVHQLLAFSRQQVLAPRRYELNQAIRDLRPMIVRFTRERIALILDTSEAPIDVFADPGQLDLVVLNLCINAVDAMPDGGTLTLTLRRDGDDALLSIADDGSGIADDDLPRIFEPFFTTKPLGTGTGLGLASALGTVTQSGGELTVESVLHRGTTFTIRLPLSQAAPEPEAATDGVTVLLCDENPYVRRACARTLQSGGYAVVSVGDPEAALSHLREHRVDALVTDVLLEGMDGLQLVARARAIQPDLRALYLSSHSRELRERLAGERCLQKPFQPAELLTQLGELLEN